MRTQKSGICKHTQIKTCKHACCSVRTHNVRAKLVRYISNNVDLQPCIVRYQYILSAVYLFIIFINIQWIESERSEDEARKSQFILSAIQSSSSISQLRGTEMVEVVAMWNGRMEWAIFCGGAREQQKKLARIWTNYFYNIRKFFIFKSRGYRTPFLFAWWTIRSCTYFQCAHR